MHRFATSKLVDELLSRPEEREALGGRAVETYQRRFSLERSVALLREAAAEEDERDGL